MQIFVCFSEILRADLKILQSTFHFPSDTENELMSFLRLADVYQGLYSAWFKVEHVNVE